MGPLDRRLGYVMRRAQIAVFEDFIATCASADIRPGQYSALTVIDCNPGLSQADIAVALGIKTPNVVAMLNGLERRGLVTRTVSSTDKRRHELALTSEGGRLLARLHKLADAHEQRLIDRVGVEAHAAMFSWLAAIAELGQTANGTPTATLERRGHGAERSQRANSARHGR